MNAKLLAAALTATALTGCMSSSLSPEELVERKLEVIQRSEGLAGQALTMPVDGQATYSGVSSFGYGPGAPGGGGIGDIVVMMGEMDVTAEFTEDGAFVDGVLSGFQSATGFENNLYEGVFQDGLKSLSEAQRAELIAMFDTPVDGEIVFSGTTVEGGDVFPIALYGALDNNGKDVRVGGLGIAGFGANNAAGFSIEATRETEEGEPALLVTEGGVSKAGLLDGMALRND